MKNENFFKKSKKNLDLIKQSLKKKNKNSSGNTFLIILKLVHLFQVDDEYLIMKQ